MNFEQLFKKEIIFLETFSDFPLKELDNKNKFEVAKLEIERKEIADFTYLDA